MESENSTFGEKFWKFVIKNIVLEIIVAVAAGLLVAFIAQEGRFAPEKLSPTPQPQIENTAQSSEGVAITPTPRVNETVTVDANVRWVDSGILIQKGDLVKISYVSGQWGPLGGYIHEGWNCDSPYYSDGIMPTAPGSSLIAKIENNAPFCVGASPVFTSQYSGNLYFSYNDCESTGCFSDNTGSLDLKVVVKSK